MRAWISAMAVMPSIPGIEMSVITTSGLTVSSSCSSSLPLRASAITSHAFHGGEQRLDARAHQVVVVGGAPRVGWTGAMLYESLRSGWPATAEELPAALQLVLVDYQQAPA
jgi:hypothetical protein